MVATLDVSTDVSHKFPPDIYMKMKDPTNGDKMRYFKQLGPLYGECSPSMDWEETIAPYIESLGFVRANNDTCIFLQQRHQHDCTSLRR